MPPAFLFNLLMSSALMAALVAHAIGGWFGVIIGIVCGFAWIRKSSEHINPFQTDADRVLRSLASSEQKQRELLLFKVAVLFSYVVALSLRKVIPGPYSDAIAAMSGFLFPFAFAFAHK